eukprot:Nk52_evm8s247 gene=Nk52_evmTU8s247
MTGLRKGRARSDSSRAPPPVIFGEDSLTATQLSDLVRSGFGLGDDLKFEYLFTYAESDPEVLVEISEVFYQSEDDDLVQCEADFRSVLKEFMRLSPPREDTEEEQGNAPKWESLSESSKQGFIFFLVDLLERRSLQHRLEAVNALLYIIMGCFAVTDSSPLPSADSLKEGEEELLEGLKENCALVQACGCVPNIVQYLVVYTEALPGDPILHRCGGSGDEEEEILEREFGCLFIKQLLNCLYVLVEVHRTIIDNEADKASFLEELMFPIKVKCFGVHENKAENSEGNFGCSNDIRGLGQMGSYRNIVVFLGVLICRYGACWSSEFPIKKILLLFWKTLVISTGGVQGSVELKAKNYQRVSGKPLEKDSGKGTKKRVPKRVLDELNAGVSARTYSYFCDYQPDGTEEPLKGNGKVPLFDLPEPVKERLRILRECCYESLGDLQIEFEANRVREKVIGVSREGTDVNWKSSDKDFWPRACLSEEKTSAIEKIYQDMILPLSVIFPSSYKQELKSPISTSTILSRCVLTLLQLMLASIPSASSVVSATSGKPSTLDKKDFRSKKGSAQWKNEEKQGLNPDRKEDTKIEHKNSKTASLLRELDKFGNQGDAGGWASVKLSGEDSGQGESCRHLEIIFKAVSATLLTLLKQTNANHIYQFEYCAEVILESNGLLLLMKAINENMVDYVTRSPDFSAEGNSFSLVWFKRTRFWKAPVVKRRNTTLPGMGSGGRKMFPGKSNELESDKALQSSHQKKEVLSKCCWRNMFAMANVLRLLQKLTKNRNESIEILIDLKAPIILKKAVGINHSFLKKYALKIIKSLVPFLGKKWRDGNMKIMTEIYNNVRLHINDNWAFSGTVISENSELMMMASKNSKIRHDMDALFDGGVGGFASGNVVGGQLPVNNQTEDQKNSGAEMDQFVPMQDSSDYLKSMEKQAKLRLKRQMAVLKFAVKEFNFYHYTGCARLGFIYDFKPNLDLLKLETVHFSSCKPGVNMANEEAVEKDITEKNSANVPQLDNSHRIPVDVMRYYNYHYYKSVLLCDGCDGVDLIKGPQCASSVNAVDLWLREGAKNREVRNSSSDISSPGDPEEGLDVNNSPLIAPLTLSPTFPLPYVNRDVTHILDEVSFGIANE